LGKFPDVDTGWLAASRIEAVSLGQEAACVGVGGGSVAVGVEGRDVGVSDIIRRVAARHAKDEARIKARKRKTRVPFIRARIPQLLSYKSAQQGITAILGIG
jgi:hypothetical protein